MKTRCAQSGFVLPLALWLIAGAIVAIAYADRLNEVLFDQALQAQAAFQQDLDKQSLTAVLLYNLNVESIARDGLPVEGMGQKVRTDGTVYDGGRGTYFSLQESASLINVNYPNSAQMPALLDRLGAAPGYRLQLQSLLADYMDTDDQRRLGGAEAANYSQNKMSGPANRVVYTPQEVFDVYGWQQLKTEESSRLLRQLTTAWGEAGLNLNTAPREVLETIPWMNSRDVELLISERSAKPIVNSADLKARLGKPLLRADDLFYGYQSSEFLRLRIWHEGESSLTEYSIRLTPDAIEAKPWLVSLRHQYRNDLSEEDAEQISILAD